MPVEIENFDLAGKIIKEIFKRADEIAELHACLTSPRGDNFRLSLLQALGVFLDEAAIERLKVESRVNEYHRHLHRLLGLGLVRKQEIDGAGLYIRTTLGEAAVNTVREFERRTDSGIVQTVWSAALGPNSIRLFLRVYGDRREAQWDRLQVTYTPAEIGSLSLFLPRTIEGISAIDKLNEAGLLVYQDDDRIHMQPLMARSFYQYLHGLYRIVADNQESGRNGNELAILPDNVDWP